MAGRKVQLSAMSSEILVAAKEKSVEMRLRRWVKHSRVDAEVIYMPFVRQILEALASQRLVLVMDGSQAGRGCMVLMVGVLYKKRALPIAWLVYKGKKGHTNAQRHIQALEKVLPLLLSLSKAAREILPIWCSEQDLDEVAFLGRLDTVLPDLNTQQRKAIIDAAAVAAYHAEKDVPVVDTLICDDAPQFNWLTHNIMLCWVHDGRTYKKLMPVIPLHRQQLEAFLKRFWDYYDQLLSYCQDPTPDECARLEAGFDQLFATQTGYDDLNQRIAKTREKKTPLLLVLQYPELPLHNNAAELAVRQRVRKRDVSFGPRTQEGLHAWDTFMTLAATARKLGISFYAYIHDRISGTNQILPMATLVEQRARELNPGWC